MLVAFTEIGKRIGIFSNVSDDSQSIDLDLENVHLWLNQTVLDRLVFELQDIQDHLNSFLDTIIVFKDQADAIRNVIVNATSANHAAKLQKVLDQLDFVSCISDNNIIPSKHLTAFGLPRISEQLCAFPDTDSLNVLVKNIKLKFKTIEESIMSKQLQSAKQKTISGCIASLRVALQSGQSMLTPLENCMARHLLVTNFILRVKLRAYVPVYKVLNQISMLAKLGSLKEDIAMHQRLLSTAESNYATARSNELLSLVAKNKTEAEAIEKMIDNVLKPLKVATVGSSGNSSNQTTGTDKGGESSATRGTAHLNTIYTILNCTNAELLTRFLNKATMDSFVQSIQGVKTAVATNSKSKKKYQDILSPSDLESINTFDIEMFSAFIQDWKTRASIIASSTSSSEFDKKYKVLYQARQELVKVQSLYDKKISQHSHACKLFDIVENNLKSIKRDINEVCLEELCEDVNVVTPSIIHMRPEPLSSILVSSINKKA